MRTLLIPLLLLYSSITWAIPTIQHWETTQGAQVYFVPAPEVPMVDIEIFFDAGGARDGDHPGIAMLTNGLLDEGAAGLSADQLSEQIDYLGAKLGSSAGRDSALLWLRSLSKPKVLFPAVELLAKIVAQPDFPEKPFERVRQQMLTTLKYRQQSPDSIADDAFNQAVFATHPYATLAYGTSKSVTTLQREQVKAFHTQYYVTKNAILSIVGDLDRPTAEKIANQVVQHLPPGELPPSLPKVAELKETKTVHLSHPSTQTHLLIGQPGIQQGDPDYFALYVGNYIFGENELISRLGNEIREKRGLAYGVSSSFTPMKAGGLFSINLQTRNDQASEALQLVQETLRKFVEQGPTEQELTEAKQGITGMFPLSIKSNMNILSQLSTIGFYHLPLDYLHTFNKNIEAVTVDMVKDVFKRRIHLDKLIIVTVGDKQVSNPSNP